MTKYVIVGIYDGRVQTVCVNGRVRMLRGNRNDFDKEYEKSRYKSVEKKSFCDWLRKRYKEYDIIAVCEDGWTKVVQNLTANKN